MKLQVETSAQPNIRLSMLPQYARSTGRGQNFSRKPASTQCTRRAKYLALEAPWLMSHTPHGLSNVSSTPYSPSTGRNPSVSHPIDLFA
ncbi:hypothetical protein L596_005435 [Steinernema carpocapsae]|uniref:Uncharacterized protein n=1 Tax=Steinernema carpocapsae TaxID=34508 RepID=A0A4U8UZ40_STECR|nr:hypothetical protein L596_005435 [Steinernema carpocapsae]